MPIVICLILALATLAAEPATAQQAPQRRAIDAPSDALWRHVATGMTFPPNVGGLVRSGVQDNTQNETDIVATYIDRGERVIALVYVYRTGAGDLPLWFDRTLATILLPQAGAAMPAIVGFTRPGASAASGLRSAMTDNVSGMRSTAIAIAPLGPGWLVKVRMGAAQLDPAALNERLTAFVAALRWPAEGAGAQVATPIAPCPAPLELRQARIIRPDMADTLIDSIVTTIEPEPGQPVSPPPVYCREPGATAERGVYRPDRSTNSYLIAINDGGLAIGVGDASGLSALLGQNNRRRFSVTFYDRNATSTYPSFNRLPPPDQAVALVRTEQPLSTTAGTEVTISTPEPGRR